MTDYSPSFQELRADFQREAIQHFAKADFITQYNIVEKLNDKWQKKLGEDQLCDLIERQLGSYAQQFAMKLTRKQQAPFQLKLSNLSAKLQRKLTDSDEDLMNVVMFEYGCRKLYEEGEQFTHNKMIGTMLEVADCRNEIAAGVIKTLLEQ